MKFFIVCLLVVMMTLTFSTAGAKSKHKRIMYF